MREGDGRGNVLDAGNQFWRYFSVGIRTRGFCDLDFEKISRKA